MKNRTISVILICFLLSTTVFTVSADPPSKPGTPVGPTEVKVGTSSSYTSSGSTNPCGDTIYYMFNFGGDGDSGWLGPYDSGNSVTASHTWKTKGSYSITVVAKCNRTSQTSTSDPLHVTCPKEKNSSAPSESSCFLADTKVATYNCLNVEFKSIQDIREGDQVLSYSSDTGEIVAGTVTKLYTHTPEEMTDGYLIIKTEDGEIRVTPNHPVFLNGQYVYASDLKVGDQFLGSIIESIEKVLGHEYSYNIEVDVYHNYMVVGGGAVPHIAIPTGLIQLPLVPLNNKLPSIAPGSGIFGDKTNVVVAPTNINPVQSATIITGSSSATSPVIVGSTTTSLIIKSSTTTSPVIAGSTAL